MFREIGHPHVPLSDWKSFSEDACSRLLIKKVIERSEIELPEWYLPLARGAAIASDHLLQRTGYRPGSGCPPNWQQINVGDFRRHRFSEEISLWVRQCGDLDLWLAERFAVNCTYEHSDQVVVHIFGSTPIFTPNAQSAMWLADYCHLKRPPVGLQWTAATPDDIDGAVKFARQRRNEEALHGAAQP